MNMTSRSPSAAKLPDLDLTQNGLKLVTLTFGINLYTGVSFYDIPHAILHALDVFLARCPPNCIKHYATETMRAHKPVTNRALNMPRTWFKRGAPQKDYVALELKSGDAFQDAPQFKYHIWSVAKSKQAKLISLAFPPQLGLEQPDEMATLVGELAEEFPFTSGLAGFAFERSPYSEEQAETYAWRTSMRHPGIDVVRIPVDAKAAGTDAIRGVNWLTLVGSELLGSIGGMSNLRAKLPKEIVLIESRHGVIIKAGPAPAIGDVNRADTLPLYRQVYKVLAPLVAIAAERSMSFQLVDDFVERTEAWYARLGA
jgi:hypothetical protein